MITHKVYFAVLNKGWLRRELVSTVLPAMQHTENVELVMENPSQTWSHPISSNRNEIVKRFLKTDCTHLLMLDDDVVPLHNPLQMVWADKDIIGSPAKVRQADRILSWVVYTKHPELDAYIPVDLENQRSVDLLRCDVIGTGCILIKRHVLENLKAPFHCEYDKDGVVTFGTDFAFCRKATDAGYEVWACRNRWCEHYKDNVGLLDISGFDDIDKMSSDNGRYKLSWGGMSIRGSDWDFLQEVMKDFKVKTVLEFGAGLSSLLMSEKAKVFSLEVSKKHAQETRNLITDNNDLTINLWNGVKPPELDKYDMVFIDGPFDGKNRGPAFEIASKTSDVIVVHDAGRPHEMQWQNKYLRDGFNLIRWSAAHLTRCHLWVRA